MEIFESRCADVVAGQHGRVIKSLGDAVLFVNEDPIRAYDTAEGIIAVIGRDPRMPDVRVGLSTGSVVTRLGDVFGPPVNMAARLTAVARRNRVIVDRATAELLPEDQFEARRAPRAAGAGLRAGRARRRTTSLTHSAAGTYAAQQFARFYLRQAASWSIPRREGVVGTYFRRVLKVQDVVSIRLPAGCGATTARSCSRARSSTCCIT